jgi:crotonobetainyl-CoA:carnitine CoA-transferase CaiB-like acyl-CoA transferase
MAQYGASVIKVEPPEGDPLRGAGPFPADVPDREASGLFLYLNANKRGITLDLRTGRGRELLLRLLDDTDALIESFEPGYMASRGLGADELRRRAPHLVVTSVSAFGQEGPYRDYRSNDLIAWAASGAMAGLGVAGREPFTVGTGMSYYATGALAAVATLGALMREDTRQAADVSLVDGMVQVWGSSSVNRGADGPVPTQRTTGGRDPLSRPMRCKDGWVGINPLSPQHWPMFCAMAGMVDLVDNPLFASGMSRIQNGKLLEERIAPWFLERSRDEIFQLSAAFNLPTGFVTSAPDILTLEQHEARDFLVDMEVPGHEAIKVPGVPVRFAGRTVATPLPAPSLGQHNSEVYGAVGVDAAEVARLREEGVI